MDALRIILFIVASYAVFFPSEAMTPDTEPPDSMAPTTETDTPTPPASTPAAPRNCVTARRAAGACVARQECDHSTGPVDHSLYAPSWYTSSCADGEVCCPFNALVQDSPRVDRYEDDFEDDNF